MKYIMKRSKASNMKILLIMVFQSDLGCIPLNKKQMYLLVEDNKK